MATTRDAPRLTIDEITAYDAAYLWLAGQLQAPLATLDRGLGLKARKYFETGR